MESLSSDFSFYFILKNGQIAGISGPYVDELLRAGNPWFRKLSYATEHRFVMKPSTLVPCDLSSFRLHINQHKLMQKTELHYVRKLDHLEQGASSL